LIIHHCAFYYFCVPGRFLPTNHIFPHHCVYIRLLCLNLTV
jgi:hypothetical protein